MKKLLAGLAVVLAASVVSAQTSLDLDCGSRSLTNDFAYPLVNLIHHNTFAYRATVCGVGANTQRGAWNLTGSVEYGTLRSSGAFTQTYQSGNDDAYPIHRVSGGVFALDLGINRSVSSWASIGTGLMVNTWSHSSGFQFILSDPVIDFRLRDTYITSHLTVGVHRTIAQRVELGASVSGYLSHRTQSLAYDEPTYLLNNAYSTQGWGTGIGAAIKARYAITHRLGVRAEWQYRRLQPGHKFTSGESPEVETFRSSVARVGISFRP